MNVPTRFSSPPGGVMTATDAGVISGELWLRLSSHDGRLRALVAYADTDDWYPVEGGDLPAGASAEEVCAHLARDLGPDEDGNPRHTDLVGYATAQRA